MSPNILKEDISLKLREKEKVIRKSLEEYALVLCEDPLVNNWIE